jgi:hypothetical protein
MFVVTNLRIVNMIEVEGGVIIVVSHVLEDTLEKLVLHHELLE